MKLGRTGEALAYLAGQLDSCGAKDAVLIVDERVLESISITLLHEGPWLYKWPLEPGGAIRIAMPRGSLTITTVDRVKFEGHLRRPPSARKRTGKCEHGIPADYCTPCEVGQP